MTISTLGSAAEAGWRVIASCRGDLCNVREAIDMRALLWRSGRAFPLALLATHLRCPICGSREIAVAFEVPPVPRPKEEGHNRYLIEQIDARGCVVDAMYRSRFNAAERLLDKLIEASPGRRFVFRDGGRVVRTHPPRKN